MDIYSAEGNATGTFHLYGPQLFHILVVMGEANRRLGKDRTQNRRMLEQLHGTCAISVDAPKTASLVFEKVVGPMELIGDAPKALITYNRGGQTHSFPAMSGGGEREEQRKAQVKFREGFAVSASPRETLVYLLEKDPGALCKSICNVGFRPVLCYPSLGKENSIFQAGEYSFLVSLIRNLGVVDEDKLTWEQVVEFRKDDQARALRGRFISWLNEEVSGRSMAEIQDRICDLFDQNSTSMKKFGIAMKSFGDELFGFRKKPESGISIGAIKIGTVLASLATTTFAGGPAWVGLTLGFTAVLAKPTYVGLREASIKLDKDYQASAYLHALATTWDEDAKCLNMEGPSRW